MGWGEPLSDTQAGSAEKALKAYRRTEAVLDDLQAEIDRLRDAVQELEDENADLRSDLEQRKANWWKGTVGL